MFVKAKDFGKYIQTIRLSIGLELGLDSADEAFIKLRELPTMEMIALEKLQTGSDSDVCNYFREVLPSIIVDHNIYEDENVKMTNEGVCNLIFENTRLTLRVVKEYFSASFFTQSKRKEEK